MSGADQSLPRFCRLFVQIQKEKAYRKRPPLSILSKSNRFKKLLPVSPEQLLLHQRLCFQSPKILQRLQLPRAPVQVFYFASSRPELGPTTLSKKTHKLSRHHRDHLPVILPATIQGSQMLQTPLKHPTVRPNSKSHLFLQTAFSRQPMRLE